ncbi:IS630 family transposase [Roseovarius sp.]|uniref:IS630 family transposase n=1 Tax=Roseovarius sp. TaxID=1486281 RepID=UPI00263487C5|nr:IS630 family transposase [Roseovarius sp.]
MGKPHPIELRTRVVAFVDEGHGHREAARHFRVSPKFVNDLITLRCETGSLLPRPQGNGGGHGKLAGVTGWIDARVTAKGEITLDELVAELAETHGIDVHRGTVWRVLRGLGLTQKKDLQALEQKRKDVADLRRIWITKRQPFMANHLERLAFIDETSVKTNMAKTTGWAPRGQRLVDHAPFGHWRTQTFIGALRHDRLDAPWVIGGAMNGEMFDRYVETQLAPTLRAGDVVILDNLSSHKSPSAARTLREIGTWFLFLPPYSPDLNPIEMAFSKLKALIGKAAARTYEDLWQAVGRVCDLFSDEECYNFFRAAGYEAN